MLPVHDRSHDLSKEPVGQHFPSPQPALVTSPGHHRGRYAPKRFKPPDLLTGRVQHQLHFENVACYVMCEQNCTLTDCMNRVRADLVRIVSWSRKERADHWQLRLNRTSRRDVWRTPLTTRVSILDSRIASFYTRGSPMIRTGGAGGEDKGSVGGRRTSDVFVKTTRRVERDADFFTNYGSKFRFLEKIIPKNPHGSEKGSKSFPQGRKPRFPCFKVPEMPLKALAAGAVGAENHSDERLRVVHTSHSAVVFQFFLRAATRRAIFCWYPAVFICRYPSHSAVVFQFFLRAATRRAIFCWYPAVFICRVCRELAAKGAYTHTHKYTVCVCVCVCVCIVSCVG
jgi:hypothetical protein